MHITYKKKKYVIFVKKAIRKHTDLVYKNSLVTSYNSLLFKKKITNLS